MEFDGELWVLEAGKSPRRSGPGRTGGPSRTGGCSARAFVPPQEGLGYQVSSGAAPVAPFERALTAGIRAERSFMTKV